MYDIIPILQHTHVICSTYHLGTRSLGAARILLRGGCMIVGVVSEVVSHTHV